MRRDRLYLQDIAQACTKLARYTNDKTFEAFASDEVLFDAVVRNLQIVGEAARALPEEIRKLTPEVEWSRIIGLRHLLVHHYFGIDEEIIWDLATNRAPELLVAVEGVLKRLPES